MGCLGASNPSIILLRFQLQLALILRLSVALSCIISYYLFYFQLLFGANLSRIRGLAHFTKAAAT